MKTKARAMRTSAKLPAYLWTEIYHAAVYLYNRTPKYLYNWKSPYERFHTFLAHRDGIVVEDRKPRLDHLRVYGCKCFAMTKDALRKANKLQKLNPNAWIGYLVGYESTNIYRVWNPKVNKVIATRDVTFNEEERFSGDLAQLKDDLLHINQEEVTRLLNNFEEPEADTFSMIGEPNGAENSQDAWEGFHGEDEDVLIPRQGWADALPLERDWMQVSNGQRLCLINQLVLPKVLVHPGMVKPIESSQPVASATSIVAPMT